MAAGQSRLPRFIVHVCGYSDASYWSTHDFSFGFRLRFLIPPLPPRRRVVSRCRVSRTWYRVSSGPVERAPLPGALGVALLRNVRGHDVAPSKACVKFRPPCCSCLAIIMRNSPSRAKYKGLPTFRAGGVASCMDSAVRAAHDGGGSHKTALTPTFFSHDHFSSSLADTEGTGIGTLSVNLSLCAHWIIVHGPMMPTYQYDVYECLHVERCWPGSHV